jgi:hypothetical protein
VARRLLVSRGIEDTDPFEELSSSRVCSREMLGQSALIISATDCYGPPASARALN